MKIAFLSQRVDVIDSYNETRDCLDQQWINLCTQLGFVAIPIPNNKENLQNLLYKITPESIILTGGVSPIKYGGFSSQRDEIDNILIQYSINKNIPLLGVCRGMQSICLYFDFDLIEVENHVAKDHKINGIITDNVNSFHSLATTNIDENLFEVLAKSEDNVIEAIKHKNKKITGIMWHPERYSPFKNEDIQLIKESLGNL